VFVIAIPSIPSLIFAGKARAYLSVAPNFDITLKVINAIGYYDKNTIVKSFAVQTP
jgi:hypothetical protein